MDSRTPIWHLGDEAVYDYVDHTLSPAAMTEAECHVQSCPDCARRLRQAELLFTRLRTMDSPRLDRDLAPGVVIGLKVARTRSVRWRWVLAAQAAAAVAALAALGLRLDGWVNALLKDPAYLALRQSGLRLVAEASAWLTPFLAFLPSFPTRLAAIRVTLPHLDGPVQGWLGLAVAALVLGLVGNAVLLRPADGVVPHADEGTSGSLKRPGPMGGGSRGGRT